MNRIRIECLPVAFGLELEQVDLVAVLSVDQMWAAIVLAAAVQLTYASVALVNVL